MPPKFDQTDSKKIDTLIESSPFATVIAIDRGQPFISHLPVLSRRTADGKLLLQGHMARANPQWRFFAAGSEATLVFHGPHSYISPTWYAGHDVPTWNYAVVQACGPVRLIEDETNLHALLQDLSEKMEGPDGWKFRLPEDLAKPGVLARAIIGFEVEAREVKAKFKLGQNRSLADQAGMVKGLRASGGDLELALLKLMEAEKIGSSV